MADHVEIISAREAFDDIWRKRMAKLTAKQRKRLPAADFAGPGRSFPIPNKSHAANAKARATQAVKAGRMSKSTEAKIDAKANKKLRGKK